jgi:lysophospholipid acyltransferase (LPLAT)-like uncharacterized protein
MKFRNNWKVKNKQWDKFELCLRLGKITILHIEADISRKFYMLTALNYCIKNR